MLFDEVLSKAMAACDEFKSKQWRTTEEQISALQPVLKAINHVLVASVLSCGCYKNQGIALEVFKAHRDKGELREWVKINITQDGMFVKEDVVTCPDECHVIKSEAYQVELTEVLKSGVSASEMVDNIVRFLADPTVVGLTSGFLN